MNWKDALNKESSPNVPAFLVRLNFLIILTLYCSLMIVMFFIVIHALYAYDNLTLIKT